MDVSRMCPATDRKKLHNDGQRRSAKLLVTGTFGLIRAALETVRVRLLIRRSQGQVLLCHRSTCGFAEGSSRWANLGE